jgi:ribonuclease P protein component
MLPRQNRLNIRLYYTEIRRSGKKLQDPYFTLYYRTQTDQEPPRINLIVSKKITKTAARRNRMRRLLHSAVANIIENIKPGFEGLFFVRQDFANETSSTITSKISKLLTSGGLYEQQNSQSTP